MKRFFQILSVGLFLTIAVFSVLGQDGDERYVGRIPAPVFPDTLDWINVDAPLTMDGLHGKIVLLDFWTYGCINCIHMIPVLEQLEERFAEELVVIGVHSAKFEKEGETSNIRQIVQRYNLHHPVINDRDFIVWQTYGIPAWPTFVIIDPLGNIVAAQSGEVPYEAFEQYFSDLIAYYDANPAIGTINRESLALTLEGAGDPGNPLLFPGKVLVDEAGQRLFIADTNHHRIVIADLATYEIRDIIGIGQRGYADGAYDIVRFDQPQGMALDGDMLYIADVNNHVIRAVDLAQETVRTIAGVGRMGRGIVSFDAVYTDPLQAELRSPWDVALHERTLYIAMAGTHQIWKLNLDENTLQAAIGNGREAQINGSFANSELAQPSGLHVSGDILYFADSESSTIRAADLNNDEVWVIAGTTDNSLFDFGDVEGGIGTSRLQHALGVTANDENTQVFIADTYNNKIRVHDVASGETQTLLGLSGNGAFRDGDPDIAQFDEPGGLDYANGLLYVADTNNHAIRLVDVASQTVQTIQFPNAEVLAINPDEPTILGGNMAQGSEITMDLQTRAPGTTELILNFTLPEGYYINTLTESFVMVGQEGQADDRFVLTEEQTRIPVVLEGGSVTISMEVTLFYCEQDAYCLVEDVRFEVPVEVIDGAEAGEIQIDYEVTLPEGFDSGL